MPLVSVVTVSYNAVDCIERTMQSVFGQTYANIEYIVIDGGSNDGTVGIIQKYASRIDYWISEKDRGIYDAMNKGIRQARGEWISFINCGDEYCGSNVLEEVFHSAIENRTGVIYGNIMFKYAWGNVEKKPDDFKQFDISKVIENTTLYFESRAFEEKKEIISDIQNNIRFIGNPDKIDELTGISLDNALKYSDEESKINLYLRLEKGTIILTC